MGNILSHHASNLIDSTFLSFARVIDHILRSINRKLSHLSSLFCGRVFGYDVVFSDEPSSCPSNTILCAPGNVCIVPASRIQQREDEKKRRSERRKRAEAAALGADVLRRHKSHTRSEKRATSVDEKQSISRCLGVVATAPPARHENERETVHERESGKLWVMASVQPGRKMPHKPDEYEGVDPLTPMSPTLSSASSDSRIDESVLRRMHTQRNLAAAPVVRKRAIQASKCSKPPSLAAVGDKSAIPVVEKDNVAAAGGFDSGHLTVRKGSTGAPDATNALHAPTAVRLPAGALSLGPSPWEPTFRNPFANQDTNLRMTSRAKQQLRHQCRPKLSLDTHLESSPLAHATATFMASPLSSTEHGPDELFEDDNQSAPATAITRPASTASNRARTPGLARKSMDAISFRSIDSNPTPLDVKTLASKAVKEDKGRRVWKDQVNKFAMARCLHQQQQQHGGNPAARRFSIPISTAFPPMGADKALTRVRTQEGEAAPRGHKAARRGSSPALGLLTSKTYSDKSAAPMLRAESPLHIVHRLP